MNSNGGYFSVPLARANDNFSALIFRTMVEIRAWAITAFLLLGFCQWNSAHAQSTSDEPPPIKLKTGGLISPDNDSNLLKIPFSKENTFKLLLAENLRIIGAYADAAKEYGLLSTKIKDYRLAQRASELSLLANQPQQALSYAEKWYEYVPQVEPFHDQALSVLMRLYLITGEGKKAERLLTPRLRVMRFDKEPLSFLFEDLLQVNNPRAVLEFLQNSLSRYLGYADVNYIIARAAELAQQKDVLASASRRAAEIQPDNERYLMLYASHGSDRLDVIAVLEKFLEKNPDNDRVRFIYAQRLIEMKRYTEASEIYELLGRKNPNAPLYLYLQGLLALDQKQPVQAEEFLQKFLAHPNAQDGSNYYLQAQSTLSDLYIRQKKYAEALAILGESDSSIANLPLHVRRAILLLKMNKSTEVRVLFDRINTLNDEEAQQKLFAEATVLRSARDFKGALALLEAAKAKWQDSPDFLYEYAITAGSNDDFELMETTLQKLLTLEPDNYRAYNALGYSFADRDIRLDESEKLLQRALDLTSNNPFVLDSWGWLKYRQSDIPAAEQFLEKAFLLQPDIEIGVHYGEILWAVGKREEALALWRKIITDDPDNPLLLSTLTRLNVTL